MSDLTGGRGDDDRLNAVIGKPIARAELQGLFGLLAGYDKVFLAVSGGGDSLAMMHLVADWLSERAALGLGNPDVTVLTVDHGLRREAREEALFTRNAARGLGLRGEILTADEPAPDTGVQEWARAMRYRLLLGRAGGGEGARALVTAHHRDDLAETVLMRLARGSGVDGLAAIEAVTSRGEVALVRPLLDIPKARLIRTLEERGVAWLEDPSNEQAAFERVRLRRARDARAALGLEDGALGLTARRAARARDALEAATDALLADAVRDPRLTSAGVFAWEWPPGSLPDELVIRALMRVVAAVGGSDAPLRLARAERLVAEMAAEDFGGSTLGRCVIAPARRTGPANGPATGDGPWFMIYREPDRAALPVVDTDLREPETWDNRFVIERLGPEGEKVRLRSVTQDDLAAAGLLGPQGRDAVHGIAADALRATPAIETADGRVILPSLGQLADLKGDSIIMAACGTGYRVRFLAERLIKERRGGRRIRFSIDQ
jgi:tRNA(Ile)-lysidine synthase